MIIRYTKVVAHDVYVRLIFEDQYHIRLRCLGPRIKFNDRSLQVWTVGLDIQRDQWQYCLLVAEIGVTRFPFWGFSCDQGSHDPNQTTTASQL